MSPELERLLEALYERDNCEPDQRGRCERNFRRMIDDALQRLPNVSHDQFLEAIKDRYQQFKKARKRVPSIPPKVTTNSRFTKNEAEALLFDRPRHSQSHLPAMEDLSFLPTVLVCPIKQGVPETIVRRQFVWQGATYTALCELARPIRRQALRPIALLEETVSHAIMERFLRVLAR